MPARLLAVADGRSSGWTQYRMGASELGSVVIVYSLSIPPAPSPDVDPAPLTRKLELILVHMSCARQPRTGF